MSGGRRPPRLLRRTMMVTFLTIALLLVVVFVVVTLTVRDQVRQSVAASLESSQRTFAALEARRQREMQAQAAALADSPTLKAAIETMQVEAGSSTDASRAQLLETIDRELQKVGGVVDADVIVLVDAHGATLSAAGRLGAAWPRGQHVSLVTTRGGDGFDGTARAGESVFRAIAVPLQLPDATIGTLYVATNLDQGYAAALTRVSGARVVILSGGLVLGSTLPESAARQFEAFTATSPSLGTVTIDGGSYAYRQLVTVGDAVIYALASIDDSARGTLRDAMRSLAAIAAAALLLGLLGSFALARLLAAPIGRLSRSLAAMAASRDVTRRLPPGGSSLEVDALTETFNALMASLADAEEQTQAAYAGAIRALAAALDARDPYTAGHSERVSVLSVAIGRVLGLPEGDLEVLRLGALLHDIGKIGVPDHILMKPSGLTDAEFAAIRQHPETGARILRPVPFLARHIPIVELHHERPDGRGYPYGLRGDDIPLAARIVHVADAYDAITSARAYRPGRPSSEALQELWRCAGTEFHADIVGALANALPGVTSIAREAVLQHA